MNSANTLTQKMGRGDFWLKNVRYIVFFGLIVIFSLMSSKFYAWNNISNLLLTTTPYAIAVVGMTFIILTGGIDLSVGAIILLSGSVAVYAANAGCNFFVSMLLAMAAGVAAGSLNGLLIAKFKFVPFLATLATMSFFRGFILQFGSSGYIMCKDPSFMMNVTQTKLLGIPVVFYLLVAIIIIAELILKKTSFGWHLYAVGNNNEAAEKIGISVTKIKFMVYVIGGLMVGITGFLNMCMIGAVPTNFGDGQEFMIISATVLGGVSLFGGKGNVFPGAIVGIFIFTIIENGMTVLSANAFFYTVMRGIVIFIAILIDSINNKGDLR